MWGKKETHKVRVGCRLPALVSCHVSRECLRSENTTHPAAACPCFPWHPSAACPRVKKLKVKGKNRQSQRLSWFKPTGGLKFIQSTDSCFGARGRGTYMGMERLWSSVSPAVAPSRIYSGAVFVGRARKPRERGTGRRRDQPWTFRARPRREEEEEEEECCRPDVRSCSWECFAFLFLAVVRWLPARRKEQPLPKRKKKRGGGEGSWECAEEKNTL